MPMFEVWSEGFLATGMEGIPAKAQKMGEAEGETFLDACDALFGANKLYRREPVPNYWGCQLFDNEADARKLFG